MHLDVFTAGNSPIHRLDPRLRLLLFLLLALHLAITTQLPILITGLTLSVGFCLLARLNLAQLGSRLAVIAIFVLLLWLVLPFSRNGVQLALTLSLRIFTLVLLAVALVATIPILQITAVLQNWRCPALLVALLFFAYKYLTILHDAYDQLRRAAKLRGYQPSMSLRSFRTLAMLIGMLLVRSLEHARSLQKALLCRGWTGRFPGYELQPLSMAHWLIGTSAVSGWVMTVILISRVSG